MLDFRAIRCRHRDGEMSKPYRATSKVSIRKFTSPLRLLAWSIRRFGINDRIPTSVPVHGVGGARFTSVPSRFRQDAVNPHGHRSSLYLHSVERICSARMGRSCSGMWSGQLTLEAVGVTGSGGQSRPLSDAGVGAASDAGPSTKSSVVSVVSSAGGFASTEGSVVRVPVVLVGVSVEQPASAVATIMSPAPNVAFTCPVLSECQRSAAPASNPASNEEQSLERSTTKPSSRSTRRWWQSFQQPSVAPRTGDC